MAGVAKAAAAAMDAVVAVPLLSCGRCWGTLDLYWRTGRTSTDGSLAAAKLLADVAASYLALADDRAIGRQANAMLAHRVLHDRLTGLPARELIEELLNHALAGSGRRGSQVAVLFIDLDRFTTVNDTYGHQAGDQVLKVVAGRMQTAVRAGDTVGRLSGDEFVVACEDILRGIDATAVLTRVGQRLRAAIAQPIRLPHAGGTATVVVTASIGIAVTTGHPTAAALIHAADTGMYQAKIIAFGDGVVATVHPAA